MYNDVGIPEIVHALTDRIDELINALGLDGEYQANDFVAYNPTRKDNHLGSFRICVKGSKKGIFQEFSSNDEGGDALELINYCNFGGSDKKGAIKWARSFLGWVKVEPEFMKKVRQEAEIRKKENLAKEHEERLKKRKWAQSIYFGAQEKIINTPVDNYLFNRGIDIRLLGRQPRSFRYAPECYYKDEDFKLPAMIASVTSFENEIVAVHRTYLQNEDGIYRKKNKMVLGNYAGGCIRVWRGDTNVSLSALLAGKVAPTPYSKTLVLTEGIEDALTIALACPQYRIWTTISIGNAANIVIPKCFDTVIFCADNDPPGSKAWIECNKMAAAFRKQGKIVKIARSSIGKDFNEQLQY